MNKQIKALLIVAAVSAGCMSPKAQAGMTGTSVKLAVGAAFGIYAYRKLSNTSLAQGASYLAETAVGKKTAQAAGYMVGTGWSFFKTGLGFVWNAIPKPVMNYQLDEMQEKLNTVVAEADATKKELEETKLLLTQAKEKLQENLDNKTVINEAVKNN
jgi:predicted sugar kinase